MNKRCHRLPKSFAHPEIRKIRPETVPTGGQKYFKVNAGAPA
jgi:hypothetical protein